MICNINSTNFEPYCRFAGSLGIPYVIITDGDYYHIVDEKSILEILKMQTMWARALMGLIVFI